ncbi:hypothetical protein [Streptomyces sp. DSM 15324]|uniref:hypothetical protein n=1 Tax=Streptomyces sp. DSM 15324 TaxID=1739111 RepID=UPI0007483879|nr:hypothetical protein [Streptomyces sp. DSM 15324]KUO10294.1 hypothetical protein AQJ58_20230 [Streptomyces sp. DSM 15324]
MSRQTQLNEDTPAFVPPITTLRESPYLSETGNRIRDEVQAMVPMLRRNGALGEELGELEPQT